MVINGMCVSCGTANPMINHDFGMTLYHQLFFLERVLLLGLPHDSSYDQTLHQQPQGRVVFLRAAVTPGSCATMAWRLAIKWGSLGEINHCGELASLTYKWKTYPLVLWKITICSWVNHGKSSQIIVHHLHMGRFP
jgi:hypothetical protein